MDMGRPPRYKSSEERQEAKRLSSRKHYEKHRIQINARRRSHNLVKSASDETEHNSAQHCSSSGVQPTPSTTSTSAASVAERRPVTWGKPRCNCYAESPEWREAKLRTVKRVERGLRFILGDAPRKYFDRIMRFPVDGCAMKEVEIILPQIYRISEEIGSLHTEVEIRCGPCDMEKLTRKTMERVHVVEQSLEEILLNFAADTLDGLEMDHANGVLLYQKKL